MSLSIALPTVHAYSVQTNSEIACGHWSLSAYFAVLNDWAITISVGRIDRSKFCKQYKLNLPCCTINTVLIIIMITFYASGYNSSNDYERVNQVSASCNSMKRIRSEAVDVLEEK